MNHKLKFGLIGTSLALLVFSPSAFSDTVHVASLTGLRTAINNAPSSGRTITLGQGVYHQHAPILILGKRNLTIRGASDNYANTVIRGPGIDNKSLQVNVKLNNSDHVTIKNLTLRDSYYHAIQINNDSDYFTADHVKTLDNGESGFKVTSPANASGPSAYSDNGVIENSSIGFTHTGRRGVVEGVDIVGAKDWRISGNHFKNIRKPNGHAAYAAFAKGNSQGIIFENNVVKNSFIGLSFGGGGTARRYFRNGNTRLETRHGAIRNNLIYDTADAGIYLNKAAGCLVYNNTVIRNGKGTGAIEARFKKTASIIYNNRVSGPIKLRNGATAIQGKNKHIPPDSPIPDKP